MCDMMSSLSESLSAIVHKRATQVVIDGLILTVSLFTAYLLRYDGRLPEFFFRQALTLVPYVTALGILAAFAFGVYGVVWRHVGLRDVARIGLALAAQTAVLVAFRVFPATERLTMLRMPLLVIATNFGISFFGIAGIRMIRRLVWERSTLRGFSKGIGVKRVLLVGTGEVAVTLAKEILNRPELGMKPIGFVDDDLRKMATIIHGLRVLGTTENLQKVVARHAIDEVIIAMTVPDSPAARRRAISDTPPYEET
jgi:FlaA1/EpsC-like NDP-sugar epimerase